VDLSQLIGAVWVLGLVVLVVVIRLNRRARRRGGAWQAGVVGAMYEWQNRDKQKALETIVESKRAKRAPESPDEPPSPTNGEAH
jgi:hypothetical protein